MERGVRHEAGPLNLSHAGTWPPLALSRAQESHPATGVLEEIGDMTPYPRPDSNGRVITSKCLQGACLKGVGKGGGGFAAAKNKAGGSEAGQIRNGSPPPHRGPAEPETRLHPAPAPPASCLCNSPCNN